MMNLVLLLFFLFFYFTTVRFLSRNEHGRVRQAEYSKTFCHHQWPIAPNSSKEVNTFIALPHLMEPAKTNNSNTSQHKIANVSLWNLITQLLLLTLPKKEKKIWTMKLLSWCALLLQSAMMMDSCVITRCKDIDKFYYVAIWSLTKGNFKTDWNLPFIAKKTWNEI